MTAIVDIIGREILDSRGNPTVEVDVVLEDGSIGRAAVPSGASTGAHEAVELRDGDKTRYLGKGVQKAVEAVNGEIFEALSDQAVEEQVQIDQTMIDLDGTPNKSRLGANAILGVSLACAKAAAESFDMPLYRYVGGTSARTLAGADDEHHQWRRACRQPDRFPGIHDPAGGRGDLRRGAALRLGNLPHAARRTEEGRPQHQCRRRGRLCAEPAVGGRRARIRDERDRQGRLQGGRRRHARRSTAPRPNSSRTALTSMAARTRPARAPSRRNISPISSSRYPIVSIEDGMSEDDMDGWKELTDLIGNKCQLVGDDLFVTNVTRLADGIKNGRANSILIKVNQIGTLTETLAAVEMAHKAGYTAVMSHRSGETEDSTIADLAVATNCGQIKTGSLARSDRTAKYNQLLRIEQQLGDAGEICRQGGAEGAGVTHRRIQI